MRGGRRVERAATAAGERLGLSTGQAYTVLTGLVAALGLLAIGLPPVLGRHAIAPAEAAASPSTGNGAPAPIAAPDAPIPLVQLPAPSSFGFVAPPRHVEGDGAVPGPLMPADHEGPALGATKVFSAVPDPGAPAGIAVGPDGTVYVATGNALAKGGSGPGVVAAFTPSGRLTRTWSIDGMATTRSVGLTDLVVDALGSVWVLDASTARVLRIDPGATAAAVVATVPDVASCVLGVVSPPCEPGLSNAAPELRGLAVRPQGGVYVADRTQGTIWSVDRAGAVVPAISFDDRLAGEGPVDVAVMGDGSLVATVSARLGSVPPGLPSVLRARVKGAGFDTPTVVVDLAVGDAPQAVVATDTGRVYVALSGANEVVDIGLDQGDLLRHGSGLDPAFDVPVGLALRDGSLLVTNQGGSGADATHWLVLALGVADRPPPLTTRSPT